MVVDGREDFSQPASPTRAPPSIDSTSRNASDRTGGHKAIVIWDSLPAPVRHRYAGQIAERRLESRHHLRAECDHLQGEIIHHECQ